MTKILIACLLGALFQSTYATNKEFDKPFYENSYQKISTTSVIQYLNDDLSAYPHLKDHALRLQETFTQSHSCAETYQAHWPRCVQGEICATFEGMKFYSQGMLVGPYHVLTIGFSMYKNIHYKRSSESSFKWADTVTFAPMIEHVEPAQALVVMAPKSWTKHHQSSISMLILDRPLGQDLGWFGISSISDTDLMNRELRSFCCPQKLTIIKVNEEFFEHDVETTKKESGAGIWLSNNLENDKSYYIIATHNYFKLPKPLSFNNGKQFFGLRADRLSEQKVRCIQNWLGQTYSNAHRKSLQHFKQVKLDCKKDSNNFALMLELAHLYRKGRGTMQDYEKAFSFYMKIVDKKVDMKARSIALYYLSKFYHHGYDRFPNTDLSHFYLKYSANNGYAKAQFMLGNMYKQGQHVTQNDTKSFQWYHKAAIQGHAEARFMLGDMYNQGQGVLQDPVEAIKWFKAAAEQGYFEAQNILDKLYLQESISKF